MESINISIQHRESSYAAAFAAALAEKWKSVSVELASEDCPQDAPEADFILCDNAETALKLGPKGIHLYDDPADLMSGVMSIDRFQPFSCILDELRALCGHNRRKYSMPPKEGEEVMFIGVTSGSGGIGTSAVTVILGRILSRLYGRKVLYVSLGKSGPSDYAFGFEPASLCLGRLLYQLNTQNEDGCRPLNDYAGKDAYGLYALCPGSDVNPLATGSREDVFHCLGAIAAYGGYERVLLDVPFDFIYWQDIMRMCEKQIIHYGFREYCRRAADKVRDELVELCDTDGLEPERRMIELRTLWDEDSFIFGEEGFDVDIHGQLGGEVRAVAENLESGA